VTGISLDVCTPEGKTWLARITGPSEQYGVERDWVRPVSRDTSRSGRTGTFAYEIGPGVYERHEGRHRLRDRNGFFELSADGTTTPLGSAGEALAAVVGRLAREGTP
jgi:hypothetical protein